MYGFENSGNIWSILIGILIAAIIIFLICREFFCWYWKINRIVALMEEQNSLLRQQLSIFISSFSNIDKNFQKIILNENENSQSNELSQSGVNISV